MICKMKRYADSIWNQRLLGTVPQDCREDKAYIRSDYMTVDSSHTPATWIQENPCRKVVGELGLVQHLVARKPLLLSPNPNICVISCCGLWHSKQSILRNHSLGGCVFVLDINPNWFLFFNFILKCTIFDLSLSCHSILIETRRQTGFWLEGDE